MLYQTNFGCSLSFFRLVTPNQKVAHVPFFSSLSRERVIYVYTIFESKSNQLMMKLGVIMAGETHPPWISVSGMSRWSLAIASLFAFASIWRSAVRMHCRAFGRHQVLFSTLGFLLCCSCDIFQVVRLSIKYVRFVSSDDIITLTYTSTLLSF
jgi:hypothetical protein